MTTLSAERLAELEAELARWKLQSDDWQKAAYANDARATAAESALAAARAEMKRALDHYDMRLEIYTNDADCAGGMADILRAALTETGHDR